MTKKVVAFGEILWDMLPDATLLGGAPFNFIHRVHSLGDRGIIMSRLGRDDLGGKALAVIRSLDLDDTRIQWDDERPTGTVKVDVDEGGNPDYLIIPDVAYDYLELSRAFFNAAMSADCICFGTLVQRSARSRETLYEILGCAENAVKFLDINLRKNCFSRETVLSSLKAADILKLNDDEAAHLTVMLGMSSETIPDFSREVLERWSLSCCLVTLGGDGVYACSGDGDAVYLPGYLIEVADTVGSGDAFSAGFVHAMLHGESLREACSFGNLLGALVATKKGGTAIVSKDELDRLHHDTAVTRNVRDSLMKYHA